jgi:hypothetical protein
MTFDELLTQVLELLQRDGRVSYRALRRRFDLDEEYLEDLKAEIIQAKKLAVDEDGAVLVWTGGTTTPPAPASEQERCPRGLEGTLRIIAAITCRPVLFHILALPSTPSQAGGGPPASGTGPLGTKAVRRVLCLNSS